MCNEKLKFGNLWNKAEALGCDYIATGHYAIIEHHDDRAVLRKGVDPRKDQSYFLFSLRQPQLRRALTPLGGMSKPAIREIARSLGLKVADKADSQEICFVPGNDYKAFLRSHLGENEFHPGGIYDLSGNFLGEHDGIELFTVGQRKGLPGGSPEPRYVVDIDAETNRVIVGTAEDVVSDEFEIDRVNWIDDGVGRRDRSDSEDPIQSSRNGGDGLRPRRKSRAGAAAFAAKSRHAGSGGCYLRWRCCAWRRLDLSPRGTRSSLTNGGRSLARAEHVSRSRNRAAHRGRVGARSFCCVRQRRLNRRFDLSLEGRSGNGERSARLFQDDGGAFCCLPGKIEIATSVRTRRRLFHFVSTKGRRIICVGCRKIAHCSRRRLRLICAALVL